MRMSRTIAVPVMLVTLVACSDSSSPTRPLAGTDAVRNNGNGQEILANGSGVADLPDPFGDLTFQFVAKARADGSAKGHFRFTRESPTGLVEFEGIVTCVTVDPAFPGRARVGGVVTANNSTAPGSLTPNHEVGKDVWFRYQDNTGEKGNITVLGFAPTLVLTSAEYCALPFDGIGGTPPSNVWNTAANAWFPVIQGTLRVKP